VIGNGPSRRASRLLNFLMVGALKVTFVLLLLLLLFGHREEIVFSGSDGAMSDVKGIEILSVGDDFGDPSVKTVRLPVPVICVVVTAGGPKTSLIALVPEWVCWIAVVCLGLWLAAERICRRYCRRPVETPFCEACEYQLTGNVSGVCPECGTKVEIKSTEKGVTNRKRRGPKTGR
jgi:hypothetical protein